MSDLEFKLKTLTPVWTGGVEMKCDRLHETGIIGSIRWWYEALVRGLDGYACDPLDGCKFNTEGYGKAKKEKKPLEECLETGLQDVCAVCRFFGCTGWSKKFRFSITDPDGIRNAPLNNDVKFSMIFKETKNFNEEEKWLLIQSLEIITKYGSIGGKTVFKPSEIPDKNTLDISSRNYKFHHQDFGLIENKGFPHLPEIDREMIKQYAKRDGKTNVGEWPDLKYFWFVSGKHIQRNKHNEIVGRDPNNPKEYKKGVNKATPLQEWLGGDHRNGKSKKIFSFHTHTHSRCWGYADTGQYDDVINLITGNSTILMGDITKGEDIINGL